MPCTACCIKQLSEKAPWKSELSRPFPPQPHGLTKREDVESLKTEPFLQCELLLGGGMVTGNPKLQIKFVSKKGSSPFSD